MIVEIALIASILSVPPLSEKDIDMTYKPCQDMYKVYKEVLAKDRLQGKLVGQRVRLLCSPIQYNQEDL